jgi:adenosylcobinamide kinase/adenosylcobinamide-phosphate guanylyltransferase
MEPSSSAAVTLILGGARSGKSRYAQALATQAKDKNVVYLATAEPSDNEMRSKIERHRRERPSNWKTIEVPLELDSAVKQHGGKRSFLLIDCLTTFTANLLMAEKGDTNAILRRIDRLRSVLLSTEASVAVVSNEVGNGIVPAYPSGCQFRDLLGEINQIMAQISRNVIFMIAGCPLVLKGAIEIPQ